MKMMTSEHNGTFLKHLDRFIHSDLQKICSFSRSSSDIYLSNRVTIEHSSVFFFPPCIYKHITIEIHPSISTVIMTDRYSSSKYTRVTYRISPEREEDRSICTLLQKRVKSNHLVLFHKEVIRIKAVRSINKKKETAHTHTRTHLTQDSQSTRKFFFLYTINYYTVMLMTMVNEFLVEYTSDKMLVEHTDSCVWDDNLLLLH